MIDFNKTMMMYDKFVDKDEVTTKELYELGLKKHDLAKFIEQGQLKRVRRGFYTVVSPDKMLFFVKYLVEKGKKEKANEALYRVFEFFPDDQRVASRLFADSIFRGNYTKAFECLDVMNETNNLYYKQDQNFWLFLLSIITEVPERYKDKIKELNLDYIKVLSNDLRYEDKQKTNDVRTCAFKFNFNKAMNINTSTIEYRDKLYFGVVTSKLLALAKEAYYSDKQEYVDLAENNDFVMLTKKLYDNSKKRRFSFDEVCATLLANDLIAVTRAHRIPQRPKCDGDVCDFYDLIKSCDYINALNTNMGDSLSSKLFEKLLENLIVETNKLLAEKVNYEECSTEDKCFYDTILYLKNNDIDRAYNSLSYYLNLTNKSQYKQFVEDLIKLDSLDDRADFFESNLTLSKLRNDDCEFSVGIYLMDFYYAMSKKDYQKAVIYLDLLSMASLVGDVELDTNIMKDSLLTSMSEDGLDESDLKGYLNYRSKEDRLLECCGLSDVFETLRTEKGVVMLAPLNKEDARKVILIANCIPNISTVVVDEDDKKRVFLKYFNCQESYVPIKDNLSVADQLYRVGNYEYCIDLYKSVLPVFSNPKPYIYKRLGLAYYENAQDNDYINAINYLSLANIDAKDDSLTSIITDLKRMSLYDGLIVDSNDICEQYVSTTNKRQYKKEN